MEPAVEPTVEPVLQPEAWHAFAETAGFASCIAASHIAKTERLHSGDLPTKRRSPRSQYGSAHGKRAADKLLAGLVAQMP